MIEYGDLLALPHREGALDPACGALSCAGAAAEALRRYAGEDARDALLDALAGKGPEWPEVERVDLTLGDVVVSDLPDEGIHVSVVVNLRPLLVLTSAERLGVFACGLSRVQNIRSYHRCPVLP